jgi:filamentous hemagglutinin
LLDHFERHGADFGAISPSEYERMASDILRQSNPEVALEKIRKNGDIVRYNPSTEEFGILSKDGVIRTYYKPDPSVHGLKTNLEYFNAQ